MSDTIQLITRIMRNVELDRTGPRNCPHDPNMPFPIVPDLASLLGNDSWEESQKAESDSSLYRSTQKALP